MATGFDYLAITSTSLPVRAIESTRSALNPYTENMTRLVMPLPVAAPSPPTESTGLQHMRLV